VRRRLRQAPGQEAHFGFIAGIGALDQPASSARTRELLGWQPREPGLLADLEANLRA
jgi:hypothetical protein